MSFRYTNDLITTIRHRLLLEAAQRSIARRTFVGLCRGIQVTCSGFGAVLSIQLKPSPSFSMDEIENFYYQSPSPQDSSFEGSSPSSPPRMLLLDRVSESIRAATWLAQQQRRGAKGDAVNRSLWGRSPATTSPLVARGLKHWYEDHPDSLSGLLPHQHLNRWCATPWMQAVQYGLRNPDRFLSKIPSDKAKSASSTSSTGASSSSSLPLSSVLSIEECDPMKIPIGSLHPLFTPALLQLELAEPPASETPSASSDASAVVQMDQVLPFSSRVDVKALRVAQRKEMRQDEEQFWNRVELIRRAQLATINTSRDNSASGTKRAYKDLSQTLRDNVEEKIELRFTS